MKTEFEPSSLMCVLDAYVCISQDFCSHVGCFQGVFRQTGPLPPRADEKDERSHPGHQQVRR